MDQTGESKRGNKHILSTVKIRYLRYMVQAQILILLLYALAAPNLPLKFLWGLDPLLSLSPVLSRAVFPVSLLLIGAGMILFSSAFGRVFCGWICPLGFIQDLVPSIHRKSRLHSDLRLLKYVVLLAGLVLPVIAGWSFLEWISPLSATPRALGLIVSPKVFLPSSALIVLLAALLSVLEKRAWCRYACPVGALLSLSSARKSLHVRIDRERCIDCLRCEEACSMGIIDVKGRHGLEWSSECILCLSCRDVCPKDAIRVELEG